MKSVQFLFSSITAIITDESIVSLKRSCSSASNFPDDETFARVCGGKTVRGANLFRPNILLNQISKYGCWCDFDTKMTTHGGPSTVNFVDEQCRQLFMNYNCIRSSNASCNARESENYKMPVSVNMINADIKSLCQAANSDECSAATCTADATFLKAIMNFSDPTVFNMMSDPSFKHWEKGGDFDWYNNCPGDCYWDGSCLSPELDCCGELPNMEQFNALNGQCCDGAITPFGTC